MNNEITKQALATGEAAEDIALNCGVQKVKVYARMSLLAAHETTWQSNTEYGLDLAKLYAELAEEMRMRAQRAKDGEDDPKVVSTRPEQPRSRRVPLTYIAVGVAAATLVARSRRQRRKTRG